MTKPDILNTQNTQTQNKWSKLNELEQEIYFILRFFMKNFVLGSNEQLH